MRKLMNIALAAAALLAAAGCRACSGKTPGTSTAAVEADTTVTERGKFSADSAMAHVLAQTAMGPRVPGSDAHRQCTDYLTAKLREAGADTVAVLESRARAWNGTDLPVRNIFAQFNRNARTRVILLAHYDTRPWADQESDPAQRETPIDGANDGASGVAVLLEVARNIGRDRPAIGVDILLTDCEDYGSRADMGNDDQQSWCLGSRHFAEHMPYRPDELPRYGILLDMVGGRNARFHQEYFSATQAPVPTAKVWNAAAALGLRSRFPAQIAGAVTDDHLPLIAAGIPVTDIIENCAASTGGFPDTWHTHRDNSDNIDPAAMADVGRVVLHVIYNEKP